MVDRNIMIVGGIVATVVVIIVIVVIIIVCTKHTNYIPGMLPTYIETTPEAAPETNIPNTNPNLIPKPKTEGKPKPKTESKPETISEYSPYAENISIVNNQIINKLAGMCLEVPNASKQPVFPIDVLKCNSENNQRWTLTEGKHIVNKNSGESLALENGTVTSGANVGQYYTVGNETDQKWNYYSDTSIRPIHDSTLCVDAANPNSINLRKCASNTQSQQWNIKK